MAELVLGVVAAVVQEAALKLWTRFQQVKGTDAESRELQEFISYLEENSSLSISSSHVVKQRLRRKLNDSKRTLEEWCSENSGFLARSSAERVRELQAQRRFVEMAITIAILSLADDMNAKVNYIHRHMRELGRAPNLPLPTPHVGQQSPIQGCVASRGRGQTITVRPPRSPYTTNRSSSAGRVVTRSRPALPSSGGRGQSHVAEKQPCMPTTGAHVRPAPHSGASSSTRPSGSAATAGSVLKTDRSATSSRNAPSGQRKRMQLWRNMWVPIDSEKQAEDLKERLVGLQGVKEVNYDLESKKVSVLVHEGSDLRTDALLQSVKRAQLKDKRQPTAWTDRPR